LVRVSRISIIAGRESQKVIKIAGTVNDTMDLDGTVPEAVEYEVGFQHEDPVPRALEDCISRYAPEARVTAQPTDPVIEFFDEASGSSWIVLRNEIQNCQQVFLDGQVAN
jgi:hypothetical protein